MNNKKYTWKTDSVIKETADTVTIFFETNGEKISYKPGQFINVQQVVGEEVVSRSYSLSSSPDEDEKPAITIKRVDGGKLSNYIFQHAAFIQQWEIDGPHGTFYADPSSMNEKPIVLIGGGSGITPLYSILKTFLKHTNAVIVLIDCNRTWNDVVFAKGISSLEQAYDNRLHVIHFLSREAGSSNLPCKNFRPEKLTKLVLKKTLKKLLLEKANEAEYFLCGPHGLITLSREALESLEVLPAQVHIERFLPAEDENTSIALPQTAKSVLLQYEEHVKLLEVSPGKSILDAALENNIPLRHSCKSGTCGTCAARQSAGRVHMMKNYALTNEELKQGYVLLCQSHPLDDKVIITIEEK